MWGSEPASLFRWLVSLWIIQDLKRHRLEVWELVAITRASVQFMGWPVECACSARAEVARSPLLTAFWCSLRHCIRPLPVCPMYVQGQLVQGILWNYTWSCWRTGSVGRTRSCRRVLLGRKVVLLPQGDRTCLMAFDVRYGGRGSDSGGLWRGSQIVWSVGMTMKEGGWVSFLD